MLKQIACIVVGALALSATVAEAQTAKTKTSELNLYATYWDVKDGDDNVWGPGISGGYYFSNELSADLRVSWFPDMGRDNFGDIESVPIDLGLTYHASLNPQFELSVSGGATYAMVNFDPNVDGLVDIDNSWGAYAGLGGTFFFTDQIGLFSNVYYRFMEFDADVKDGIPFRGDDTLEADGVNVDLGLKFLF